MASRIMELAIAIKGRLDGSVGSSMQRAAKEASNLRKQISDVNKAMRDAQKAASAEQRATGSLSTATAQHLVSLQSRLNDLTQRRTDLLDAQAGKERASAGFSKAKSAFGTAVGATAVAAAPLAGMIATAANFEQGMSKVQAITNSTDEDMAKLSATAQDLGAKTQFSASQAAEAMSYLGMAGWKTDQIIAGMPGLLDLAAASGEDLARVSDIVSDDLTAFGMSADQASHMADVMAATSTNANTNVSMMGETFKYVGSLAGALGYSLEDVSVATGVMANAGIKGEQAGTSLRAIMTRLVDPPKEAATALDQLGISVTNSDGTMKPFMQTMEELRDRFGNMSEAEKAQFASTIAGQEAMSGFLAIVNTSEGDFEKLCDAVDNADGAAARMAGTMNDNAKGGAVQLQSAIEGLSIAVGQIFLPSLAQLATWLATNVGGFANWAKENQGLVAGVLAVAGALTGIVIAGLGLNVVIQGINSLVASAKLAHVAFTGLRSSTIAAAVAAKAYALGAKVAAAAQMAFNAVMSANPIALAVLAIMALVAAVVYFYNTNETFRAAVLSAWEAIKSGISMACSVIAAIGSAVWAVLSTAARVAFVIITAIVMAGVAVIASILGALQPIAQAIWAGIVAIVQAAVSVMLAIWAVVGPYVMAVWNAIMAVVSAVMSTIMSIVDTVISYINSLWDSVYAAASAAWDGITGVVQSVMDSVMSIVDSGAAWAEARWNSLAETLSHPIDAVVNYVTGGDVSHNARGGIYERGAFLTTFAEDSAEAAIPLDGSQRAISLWKQAGERLGMATAPAPLSVATAAPVAGGTVQLEYSPTISVGAGADASAVAMIRDALAEQARQFEAQLPRMLANVQAGQRRLAYD